MSVHRLVQAVTLAQLVADQATAWRQAAGFLIESFASWESPAARYLACVCVATTPALVTIPPDDPNMTRFADFLGFSGNYTAETRSLPARSSKPRNG